MPGDLPGLYWDENKKRYFPLSSRPASHTRPSPERSSWDVLTALSKWIYYCQREASQALLENLYKPVKFASTPSNLSHNIVSLSEGMAFWHGDVAFTCLDVDVQADGSFVASSGDHSGWLQTFRTDKYGYVYSGSRELFLGSQVTAVCKSDSHRLAVSFGPSSKIAVKANAEDAEIWNIISMGDHRCHDVRAAHLLGKSLVLGAAKRGILLPDIQSGWSFDVLATDSDVLSVYQLENAIYTGSRNGSIHHFDRRLNTRRKGQELFRGRYSQDTRSITHVSILHESQMLVSTVKGDLELLDLRFARVSEPAVAFEGHVNRYMISLGISTTPCSSYVFAAGQDRRIRAWSLLTGQLISPTSSTQSSSGEGCTQLFKHTFEGPISAIRVTEGGGGGGASPNGMTLWAASGKKIYRFWLGQRVGGDVLGN